MILSKSLCIVYFGAALEGIAELVYRVGHGLAKFDLKPFEEALLSPISEFMYSLTLFC